MAKIKDTGKNADKLGNVTHNIVYVTYKRLHPIFIT